MDRETEQGLRNEIARLKERVRKLQTEIAANAEAVSGTHKLRIQKNEAVQRAESAERRAAETRKAMERKISDMDKSFAAGREHVQAIKVDLEEAQKNARLANSKVKAEEDAKRAAERARDGLQEHCVRLVEQLDAEKQSHASTQAKNQELQAQVNDMEERIKVMSKYHRRR